jgi:hypothetical protein
VTTTSKRERPAGGSIGPGAIGSTTHTAAVAGRLSPFHDGGVDGATHARAVPDSATATSQDGRMAFQFEAVCLWVPGQQSSSIRPLFRNASPCSRASFSLRRVKFKPNTRAR